MNFLLITLSSKTILNFWRLIFNRRYFYNQESRSEKPWLGNFLLNVFYLIFMSLSRNIISNRGHFDSTSVGMIGRDSILNSLGFWIFRMFLNSTATPLRYETFKIQVICSARNRAVRIFDLPLFRFIGWF